MATKIKPKDISPVTVALLKKQGYVCPLCKGSLKANAKKNPVLDHDHQTGAVRDALCRNCNGLEGKVFNLARRGANGRDPMEWLADVVRYWHRPKKSQHGLIHPTHKTAEEKRLARNKKARARRAAAKRVK